MEVVTRQFEANQLVLIKEDNLPPLQWRLARILEVYPGSDQKVRVAQVRAATGVYLRPITKLARFPSNLNQGSAAGGSIGNDASVDGWEDVISNPTISYDDFLNVDDDVAVCGEITDADIIAEVLNHNIEKQDGDEASGDEDESSVAGGNERSKCGRSNELYHAT
ncbi:hypothetical protein LAZ67_3005839 [Cordylochernes scorpioides]|uniref:DUF5641 domain-containing protein n=1 Tax=Cordylochernes scorpioides TaxID=51811 RepID=A0ABY6KAV5_9ARAC|nr:hypothetical protein LAZ67_3005839 [Cordylochernes scorpioides]